MHMQSFSCIFYPKVHNNIYNTTFITAYYTKTKLTLFLHYKFLKNKNHWLPTSKDSVAQDQSTILKQVCFW